MRILFYGTKLQFLFLNHYFFCRKAFLQVLPTESNLHRWKKSENPYCRLCNQIQSNLHVLSNCASILSLERYKTRHDNILKLLSDWILFVETICIVFIRGFTWFQFGSNWMCFSSKCPPWSHTARQFKNCSFGSDNLSREKYSEITFVQNEQIQRHKFTLAAEIQKASSASVYHRNFSSRFYLELERFLHVFQNPKYANFA